MPRKTKASRETVIAYKGFTTGMTCRNFPYAIGETYRHDGPVEACRSGFHAGAALANGVAVHTVGCAEFSFVNHPLVTQHETLDSAFRAALATPPAPAPDAGEAIRSVRAKGERIEREANAMQDVGASLEAKIRIKVCDEILAALSTPTPQPPSGMSKEDLLRIFRPLPEDELSALREVDPHTWGDPDGDTPQPPAVEAEAVRPLAWRALGGDGVPDVTDSTDVMQQWVSDDFEVEPLYSEAALKAKNDEIERLRQERDEANRLRTVWFETHLGHQKALDALGAANGELFKRAMDAESRAEAAEASNKELTRERDHWKADSAAKGHLISSGVFIKDDEYANLHEELRELRASNKALREGLEPFAYPPVYVFDTDSRYVPAPLPASWIGGGWFSTEDFRRARALLSETGGE